MRSLYSIEEISQEHLEFLASKIIDGAVLRAESDWNDEKFFLAYILKDDPAFGSGANQLLNTSA